ncbi:class I SAM-dependent methyltransferase [Kineosporia babensis]|uniref:Methyltransferase domain-containing protein n=1 Tax=Kineosporia babensis TaxID=499548 RepID=A0A9X1NBE5_9ACTN|nr:methyltransferase domain-containing protein [Kineosporia babensis]MCD5310724.1 methyltransferase domain-containing protein [Kineosporia babensis]
MTANYGMERTSEEYQRLRFQARYWEPATARLIDRISLPPGASCLDAGCGPGETMRLLAERTGPSGQVVGLDSDVSLGVAAQQMLHELGHTNTQVLAHQIQPDEPLPGGPYDLVASRLLLLHLPQRVEVLARLWEAVAPGGHLLIQDYDMAVLGDAPLSPAMDAYKQVMDDAFGGLGVDLRTGTRLPVLFAEAGIGAPDGTDIAGEVGTLASSQPMLEQVVRGVLPAAVAVGAMDAMRAESVLRGLAQEAAEFPDRPMLPPLLVGAWKRKG